MNDFDRELTARGIGPLLAGPLESIQINVGLKCNLACTHCHLEANRDRDESMDWETMAEILRKTAHSPEIEFDITGGSPELNPHLTKLLSALKTRGTPVRLRTNLVLLSDPAFDHLAPLFAENRVKLTGSLPCYLEENVNAQRGDGVMAKAVEAIRRLNSLGYGKAPDLVLDLVYNPGGPFLPPPQGILEEAYKRELGERYGITFTSLAVITNMALGRFEKDLDADGKGDAYRKLLKDAFNPETVQALMCRKIVNIGWDGTIADCDFNRALGLFIGKKPITQNPTALGSLISTKNPTVIEEIILTDLLDRQIITGNHCFGCTAGQGSSCGGALDKAV